MSDAYSGGSDAYSGGSDVPALTEIFDENEIRRRQFKETMEENGIDIIKESSPPLKFKAERAALLIGNGIISTGSSVGRIASKAGAFTMKLGETLGTNGPDIAGRWSAVEKTIWGSSPFSMPSSDKVYKGTKPKE